jgi:hypothetical protein
MFDLVPFEPGALGQPLAPEIASARRYVEAAQAASTERAYHRGWGDFCAWSAFLAEEEGLSGADWWGADHEADLPETFQQQREE